jgi:hypothetical protein
MSFNGSALTNDRWVYPSRYYSFETSVPVGGDTVQIIMLDTESLIGGQNVQPLTLPPLFYPPPASRRAASRRMMTADVAAAATLGASAATPSAAAAGAAAYAASAVTATPETAAAAAAAQSAATTAYAAAAAAGYTFTPPPVDEAQWNWLEGQLNSSTSDWIIVVGYHPVWSAGAWGPTWPLVERLVPMMQTAGVGLYVSGTDHLMQHFTAVPMWTNVDFVVVGNGAYAMPPGTTAAQAMPHALDCPDGGLQFSFGATSGFASLQVTTAGPKNPSELHVNFYDSNQTMIYSFFKENPRTIPGHSAGDLRSPPAPGRGGASSSTYNSKPVIIMGGAFLVVAVLLCLIGAASHARRQIMYLSALRGGRGGAPGDASGGEQTPLMLGRKGAPAAWQAPPGRR